MVEEFNDGVFYIPLESITKADLAVKTIAHELGIPHISTTPVGELLKDYLKEKQVLLVLDNFEQVLTAASFLGEPKALKGAARGSDVSFQRNGHKRARL